MPPEKTDADVMREAASGDADAFGLIAERHYRVVFRVAMRFLSHPEDARDATQEVFMRAFQAAARFRQEEHGSVKGWLLRITANLCLNELKSARARRLRLVEGRELDEREAQGEGAMGGMLKKELEEKVREAVERLAPDQRMALVLSRYEGLSYREIAEVMERSVPSVESLLVRAKQALLGSLDRYLGLDN